MKLAILPELVGKWFTKQKTSLIEEQTARLCNDVSSEDGKVWCRCKGGEDCGAMNGCDNEHCPIQWFHFLCLKVKSSNAPKGKWYCPECHKYKKGITKKVAQ